MMTLSLIADITLAPWRLLAEWLEDNPEPLDPELFWQHNDANGEPWEEQS